MSREEIMLSVNKILETLEFYDEEFVDCVIVAITNNEPFTDEEIADLS